MYTQGEMTRLNLCVCEHTCMFIFVCMLMFGVEKANQNVPYVFAGLHGHEKLVGVLFKLRIICDLLSGFVMKNMEAAM